MYQAIDRQAKTWSLAITPFTWKLLQFRVRRNVSWVPACQVRRKTRLLARPSQGNATNGAPFSSPQPRRVKSNRVDSTLLNFQKSSSARERRRASERSIFRPRGSCSRAWVPPTASIFHVLHGNNTTAVFIPGKRIEKITSNTIVHCSTFRLFVVNIVIP